VVGRIAARRRGRRCAHPRAAAICGAALVGLMALVGPATAQPTVSDFALPPPDDRAPILFGGDEATRWTKGSYEVWVLRGRCYVQQGATAAEAQQAVLWVRRGMEFDHQRNTVIAYLEGDVRIIDGRTDQSLEIRDRRWYGEFTSTVAPDVRTPPPREGMPSVLPQVFVNAEAHRDALLAPIRRAQHVEGSPGAAAPLGPTAPLVPVVGGGRRLRAFSRSSVKVQVKWIPSPGGQEWVGLISPGVNLIIDGLADGTTLDIATDRMVVWTSGVEAPDLSGAQSQGQDRPLEIYMEGNIVFREGTRVVYADRMYYNVNTRTGTLLNAEVLAPIPSYEGMARLKADIVRQTGEGRFEADRGSVTSSRMADPRYRLQSQKLSFADQTVPVVHPLTRQQLIDPLTGEPLVAHDRLATGTNNLIFVGPVPVFYWPTIATDLEDPRFFVRNVKIKNDQIFGQQVRADLDMYQLLGFRNKPKGNDWTASLDFLSERGLGFGSTYRHTGTETFGIPGNRVGAIDGWAIYDNGLDYLGSDRQNLFPEEDFRYRLFSRTRVQLPDNFRFTLETGLISDRNFLEQYFETEWDTFKDHTLGFELKHLADNTSWALSADMRVNDFFTQTNQWPRLDHFWLGQSLLGDTLTWYEHSSVEYAKLEVASTPENPADAAKFALLPWEADVEGLRGVTAQEINLPLTLGPMQVVPYAMGQAGHWGEVLDGEETQRLYGQAGIRAALPFWSANPSIQSELLNVNGIAHKIVFDVDASWAEANRDLDLFPLYDPLDDDAQEHFRRRFAFNTFGGVTPPQFDERFYAVRSGLAGNVTNPAAEIAEDLMAVRMGVRQRWQTKRGTPARPRIVDWIVLDTEVVYFPDADRDNFGEDFGLASYDFRWHVGERLTFLSDGGFDFFDQGRRTISVGAQLTRPTNGTLYLGYRSLEGPFSMQIAIASLAYRLSPKWIGTASLSYDFSGTGTLGNALSLVRVGESFLVGLGFNADVLKDNNTVMFTVEPRFVPSLAKSLRGVAVPPPGVYGLE
jgi:hypothetical protein